LSGGRKRVGGKKNQDDKQSVHKRVPVLRKRLRKEGGGGGVLKDIRKENEESRTAPPVHYKGGGLTRIRFAEKKIRKEKRSAHPAATRRRAEEPDCHRIDFRITSAKRVGAKWHETVGWCKSRREAKKGKEKKLRGERGRGLHLLEVKRMFRGREENG